MKGTNEAIFMIIVLAGAAFVVTSIQFLPSQTSPAGELATITSTPDNFEVKMDQLFKKYARDLKNPVMNRAVCTFLSFVANDLLQSLATKTPPGGLTTFPESFIRILNRAQELKKLCKNFFGDSTPLPPDLVPYFADGSEYYIDFSPETGQTNSVLRPVSPNGVPHTGLVPVHTPSQAGAPSVSVEIAVSLFGCTKLAKGLFAAGSAAAAAVEAGLAKLVQSGVSWASVSTAIARTAPVSGGYFIIDEQLIQQLQDEVDAFGPNFFENKYPADEACDPVTGAENSGPLSPPKPVTVKPQSACSPQSLSQITAKEVEFDKANPHYFIIHIDVPDSLGLPDAASLDGDLSHYEIFPIGTNDYQIHVLYDDVADCQKGTQIVLKFSCGIVVVSLTCPESGSLDIDVDTPYSIGPGGPITPGSPGGTCASSPVSGPGACGGDCPADETCVINAGGTACECQTVEPVCGNGVVETGEECDPPGSVCTLPPASGGGSTAGTCTAQCTCEGEPL